jgi:threonine dehydrogenase-like Zn-dependent dehydrogenase
VEDCTDSNWLSLYNLTMRALVYQRSIPRYAWIKLVGGRTARGVTGPGSSLSLADVPGPRLVGPTWLRIKPTLAGICGSDLAVLNTHASLYAAAFTSFPFVPGHEMVGIVSEVGTAVTTCHVGDRLVLEPALGCIVRGFREPCSTCARGRYANCERVTQGDISEGLQTGYCRDTGGGWGTEVVAHETQVHVVTGDISDAAAVLIEPLSCCVHAVTQASVPDGARVLVIGCGSVGLMTIAALKYLRPSLTVVALARHAHQQEIAEALGAEHVVSAGREAYKDLAQLSGASLHKLTIGKPAVVGGFDATFDCVGSSSSIEDAVNWTRAQGTAMLVGMPGPVKVDLAALWQKEISLLGAYAYGDEVWQGRSVRTFDLALEMMTDGWAARLAPLVTHTYPISQYREAIATALSVGRRKAVKTVFDLTKDLEAL